jgi:ADP-heptose:LPS heptosyltransferase
VRILIVRNDRLGDFMLAWPCFAMLKHYWPQAELYALVPHYTSQMAQLCPWLDGVIEDEGESALKLAQKLQQGRFDAQLTLYSTGRVALAGFLARIPYRLAPATKLFQFLYNRRLLQRRSRSEKPEYAYNIDLAYRLLADLHKLEPQQTQADDRGDFLPAELTRPLLQGNRDVTRSKFARANELDEQCSWVIIHPGCGGSANNLSATQYARLALQLESPRPLSFLISVGPGEEELGEEVAEAIRQGGAQAKVVGPAAGLASLVDSLQWADLFISGSTGPLHVAAALGIPTAAFYPRHRSATPLRWQTINAPEKRLAFTPPSGAEAQQVQQIDITAAARLISSRLLGGKA